MPHEAWHVMQQKQGRVRPTTMMKAKVPINDDAGLEKEADVMGARALQMKPFSLSDYSSGKSVQRAEIVESTTFNPMHQQLEDEDAVKAPEKSGEDTTATVGPFTYEGWKVSMDLLGQKISLDKKGAGLELPKGDFKKDLPALDVNLDIPLYPNVYATAGLTITPKLNIILAAE